MDSQKIYQSVGENAGLIWQTLDKNGEMEMEEVRKQTILSVEEFHLALGWLLRENKLVIFKNEDKLMIQLIY